jgi:hypothetical protein
MCTGKKGMQRQKPAFHCYWHDPGWTRSSVNLSGTVIHERKEGGRFILQPLPECYLESWLIWVWSGSTVDFPGPGRTGPSPALRSGGLSWKPSWARKNLPVWSSWAMMAPFQAIHRRTWPTSDLFALRVVILGVPLQWLRYVEVLWDCEVNLLPHSNMANRTSTNTMNMEVLVGKSIIYIIWCTWYCRCLISKFGYQGFWFR